MDFVLRKSNGIFSNVLQVTLVLCSVVEIAITYSYKNIFLIKNKLYIFFIFFTLLYIFNNVLQFIIMKIIYIILYFFIIYNILNKFYCSLIFV